MRLDYYMVVLIFFNVANMPKHSLFSGHSSKEKLTEILVVGLQAISFFLGGNKVLFFTIIT